MNEKFSKLMIDINSKIHAGHRTTYWVNIKENYLILPEREREIMSKTSAVAVSKYHTMKYN